MKQNQFIPSVNFHLWEPCNMRCAFCFATFQDVKKTILPKGHLPKDKAIAVVENLASYGFEKITFAGGEPTLCPWLSELIYTAKKAGMTTMIVSNGSRLSDEFLKDNASYLDWIAVSIDSLYDATNLAIGRAIVGKRTLSKDTYLSLLEQIKMGGYGLKINTVVNSKNYQEDFTDFIKSVNPQRWKVLQVLPMLGQNDGGVDEFKISESQFRHFLKVHQGISVMIPETNTAIKGSYVMVDPAGRFFDNFQGTHNYSPPILEIGVQEALKKVNYDFDKFIHRGGIYRWRGHS